MITLAAIEKNGVVYVALPGQRHNHIICDTSRPFGFMKGGIQGFVDEKGKFYNRHDAACHAFECGQLSNDKECPDIIISEDLW
ncbi:MAG: hypothetical protein PHF86_03000 [Candidatus Nanoarchaeia archaeon]|jgi:hypothetical protein|nr:hypothetical protein [Candidatus Nanoarchaeia archaeon]